MKTREGCNMKADPPQTRIARTWFGLMARMTIGPGFMHWAAVDGTRIPHPPLANWLLRKRLPQEADRRLSFAHEFAHFQTAPILAVYMMALFTCAYLKNRNDTGEILILLASCQALWELLSEGLVVMEASAQYRASYDGIPHLPRVLFWVIGMLVASAGWLVAI